MGSEAPDMKIIKEKKKYDKRYYLKHKAEVDSYRKKWIEENKARYQEKKMAWYLKNKDTEEYKAKRRAQSLERRRKTPEKWYEIWKKSYDKRRRVNPNMVISLRLRNSIRKSLKRTSEGKTSSLRELLGISVPEFRELFFSKFKQGMTMKDFVAGKIHVDHIRPLASFDLSDVKEQRKAFHYSNLQPLWAEDNIRKGAKIV